MELLVLQTFALFYTLNTLEYVGALDIHRHSERIPQGADGNIQGFPYYAGLLGCGATIISESWVVTVAHCLLSAPILVNKVWVGGPSLSTSEIVTFDNIVLYDPEESTDIKFDVPINDIALLHLSEPLTFSDAIRPVELPSFKDLTRSGADSVLAVAARGYDEDIEKMDLLRLSTEECLSYLPPSIQEKIRPIVSSLEKAIICAKRADGRPGMCQAESGSPLMEGNTLVGIASSTGLPCEEAMLEFYVNVANYVPWIKSVTGLE